MFGIYKPAPAVEPIADASTVARTYGVWRLRVFYSMFIGYAFYYFTRNSLAFAMPAMITDLGYGKGEMGILMSVWAIAYGVSKFVSGMIGDRSNARYFMATGLVATGLCNIAFGGVSSLGWFALFWGLNGWFQGCGWPACARLLTHWYSQGERGRWWGMWNVSHNIGGAVIPLVTALFAQLYGWRCAMIFPGVISIGMGLWLINRLCDTPQSLGLPPIEQFRNDYPTDAARHEKEHELTMREILMKYVLTNPYIWLLAGAYFFVYIVRMGITGWMVLYLVEAKGYTPLGAGGVQFWFEIGGACGSLLAGWCSDVIWKGRRAPINVLFSLGVAAALAWCWASPSDSVWVDSALVGCFGLLIFGPQMLIGMMAAELSHKKAAATASGFVGLTAYVGSAMAGYPLGQLVQAYGWGSFFVALAACGAFAACFLLPLWNVRARQAKEAKAPPEQEPLTVEAAE